MQDNLSVCPARKQVNGGDGQIEYSYLNWKHIKP